MVSGMAHYYNVHDIVKIKVHTRNPRIIERINHVLRYFEVSERLPDYHVEIRDLDDFSLPDGAYNVSNTHYGFDWGIYNREDGYAIVLRDGRWILYAHAANAALVNPIIQHHLLIRHKTFVHGAGISIEDQGVIFPGFGEAGKTLVISRLLQRHDVRFFGDDYVIVDNDSNMHSYPMDFSIYARHFRMFPELNRLSGKMQLKQAQYKQALANIAKTLLLKDILKAIARLVNYDYGTRDYLKIPAEQLIGSAEIWCVPL